MGAEIAVLAVFCPRCCPMAEPGHCLLWEPHPFLNGVGVASSAPCCGFVCSLPLGDLESSPLLIVLSVEPSDPVMMDSGPQGLVSFYLFSPLFYIFTFYFIFHDIALNCSSKSFCCICNLRCPLNYPEVFPAQFFGIPPVLA